ncbi:hypothetical protein EVAR_63455_1 [Eumeta japonica]|uniref:Uncharacterized protein n=1 Tax=Eumeta variegata TaxID=151549 RepID=A0A4C1ZWN2_EUMVA|nr:hypothetical protein EVAR_63455_1 [Eumeta japonica]
MNAGCMHEKVYLVVAFRLSRARERERVTSDLSSTPSADESEQKRDSGRTQPTRGAMVAKTEYRVQRAVVYGAVSKGPSRSQQKKQRTEGRQFTRPAGRLTRDIFVKLRRARAARPPAPAAAIRRTTAFTDICLLKGCLSAPWG